MKFKSFKGKKVMAGKKVIEFKSDVYETTDEVEIEALMKARNVSYEDPVEDDEELESLRAEYKELSGEDAHHRSGVEKLKEDIKSLKEAK
jgi:hypothetical protein